MSQVTERAWAAGFFDGEGCTCAAYRHDRGVKQLTVVVMQSGAEGQLILNRFCTAVGAGSVTLGRHATTTRQIVYQWRIRGLTKCHAVMCVLWPYLSIVKRAQFNRAVQEVQMEKQVPEMDGIGMSGRGKPPEDVQIDVTVSMNTNDGGNPAIGPGVPAPTGTDPRNHEGGNISDSSPSAGMGPGGDCSGRK
jgi:hypothetical protein